MNGLRSVTGSTKDIGNDPREVPTSSLMTFVTLESPQGVSVAVRN